jgi:transglutaminase-like putative cysteine protease
MSGLVSSFEEIRDLPYAIDAAHDAAALERLGAGDCLAKSERLAARFEAAGAPARLVRWRYELPAVVPEALELPSRLDVHRAVQVRLGDEWVLVDATHDPALAAGGLTVATWDGAGPTAPAYPMIGPLLVEAEDRAELDAALAEVRAWLDACDPALLAAWRTAYARWLRSLRPRSSRTRPRDS